MPDENVRGFKVRAMQFEHPQTRQAAQCAGHQSRGSGVHCKSAAQHEPAQQSRGDGMEKSGDEARDACRKEMIDVVVAEQSRKYGKQCGAAERQQRTG